MKMRRRLKGRRRMNPKKDRAMFAKSSNHVPAANKMINRGGIHL